MRNRSPILQVPDSDRYWSADLGDKGEHHFRFPTFALAGRIQDWVSASELDGKGATFLYSGVLVGACWYHRAKVLDAVITVRSTDAEIDAFAESVIEELQDAGYSVGDINILCRPCDQHVAAWVQSQTKVVREALANFKKGQQEGGQPLPVA